MIVKSMFSSRGNAVPNQFIIFDDDNAVWFQSYSTMICRKKGFEVDLDKDWQYSRTTSKYLYSFLGIGRKEIEKKIANMEIVIKDLNGREN